MNREIKFRGKSLTTSEWLYGSLFNDGAEDYILPNLPSGAINYEEYQIDSNTIGQLTGLKDKNGKHIYEGDILRVKEYENLLMYEFSEDADRFDLFTLEEIKGEKRAEYVSPVVWREGAFDLSTNGEYFDMWLAAMFGDMKRSSPVFEFEVIGNRFENPELLPELLFI